MARIYLDANYFIGTVNQRKRINLASLSSHVLFISPLSVHVLYYVYKIKVPDENISKLINFFNIVSLTENLLKKSVLGPTSDLEDNIQLHSASAADCDVFLTEDKILLKMKFFGKSAITDKV